MKFKLPIFIVSNKRHIKKVIFSVFFFVILIFVTTSSSAQAVNKLIDNVTMDDPSVAALQKYSDVPVSYSSGVPNINIPIFNVQEGELSLPISLSYHASGVRVVEPASRVGLGWSLNAGGVISRTIVGKPDEGDFSCLGFWNEGRDIDPFNFVFNPGAGQYDPLPQGCISGDLCDVINGRVDSEPDIFSFNFGNYSGKFWITPFDQNGDQEVILIPEQDLKIEKLNNSADAFFKDFHFRITTPDGIQYLFGESPNTNNSVSLHLPIVDSRQVNQGINNHRPQPTNWFLTRILSADEQSNITLNYEKERYSYTLPPNRTQIIGLGTNEVYPAIDESNFSLPVITGFGDHKLQHFPFLVPVNETYMDIFGVRVSKIENSSGTQIIEFNCDELRQDMVNETTSHRFNSLWGAAGSYKLNSINIFQGTYCKSFDFSYSYFKDDSTGKTGDKDKDFRLRLNSLQEIGCQGMTKPPYIFKYNSAKGKENLMPNRFTKAVDHWGFYNGEENNNDIHDKQLNIPSINNGFESLSSVYEIACESDDVIINRETNERKMKLGTLEKITFPTGGSHEFIFEANDYFGEFEKLGDVVSKVGALCPQAENAYSTNEVVFSFTDNLRDFKYELVVDMFSGTTTSFNLNVVKADDYSVVYSSNKIDVSPSTIEDNTDCGFLADLIDISNIPKNIPIVFELSSNINECYNGSIRFELKEPCKLRQGNRKVGGLRIKKTIAHDGNSSNNDIIKTYHYTRKNAPSLSSGILFQLPKYNFNFPIYSDGTDGQIFFENSRLPLNSFEGRHITYEYVEERSEGNGSTLYEFYTEENLNSMTHYPSIPVKFNAESGKQKKIEIENGNGEIVSTRREIPKEEEYKYYEDSFFKAIQHTIFIFPDLTREFVFGSFYNHRTKPFRIRTVVTVLDGVRTITHYEFNSDLNVLAPTAMEVKNSDNKLHRTTYLYGDTDSCLSDHGMTGVLLEERNYVDGALVGGTGTNYSNFEFNGTSACKPVSSYQIGESGQKYTRFSILEYTDDGLPFKVQTDDYPIEELTWQNRLLTKREWGNHKEEWLYWDENQTRLLKEKIDIDDLSTNFEFDEFFRLSNISSRDGKISTDYDYDYHNSGQVPNFGLAINHISTTTNYEGAEEQKTTEVLDGLGRPVQSIQCAYSPDGNDVRQSTRYDNIGRPFKNYQVIEVGNSCSYLGLTGTDVWETTYEKSPLNRPVFNKLSSWPAGVGTMYDCNSASDQVKIYEEGCGTNSNGLYPSCSLNKVTNVDENGNPTETFTDKIGRQVLVRKFIDKIYSSPLSNQGDMEVAVQIPITGSKKVDTYYVYGDKGNVVLVISPEAADGSSGDLNYCYAYDDRSRMILKDLPGSGPMTMGYYDSDLLKWETDAIGNTINYVYDEYGRLSKKYLNGSFDDEGNVVGGDLIMQDEYFQENGTNAFKSKLRSTGVAAITGDNVVGPLLTTEFKEFDDYARVKNTISTNNVGGEDIVTYVYADHADNIDNMNRLHKGYETVDLTEHFSYDHSFRNISHSLNSSLAGESLLSSSSYTYKDELKSKTIGGTTLDYQYNTRSWLTNINTLGTSLPFDEYDCVPEVPITIDLDIGPFIPCDEELAFRYVYLTDFMTDTSCAVVHFQVVNCDSMPECPTSTYEMENLAEKLSIFKRFVASMDAFEMGYPQNLIRIRLCDGSEMYITDSQILYAQINGIEIPDFIILQEICISNIMQTICYTNLEGENISVPFFELVDILNNGLVPQIEEYPKCGEERICSYEKTHIPIRVSQIGTNTFYGVDDGPEFGDCDVTDEYFDGLEGRAGIAGICTRGIYGHAISENCKNRADVFCFDFEVFEPNCEDAIIDSVKIFIDFEFFDCNDNTASTITINNHEFELGDEITILGDERIQQICIELPNDAWESAIYCSSCVYNISRTTFYTCDCSTEDPPIIEDEYPFCSCVPDTPDDPIQCVDELPECSVQEIAEQEIYIAQLMTWAESVPQSHVTFPIIMCRTTLCDGRQISIPQEYLDEHPLPGPHECEEIISPQQPIPEECNISNPLFAMKFSYENPNTSYSGATPQYNGNISQIEQQLVMKHIEGLNYQYDQLDRLTEQNYWWKSCKNQYWNNKFFNVDNIEYDLNGNMESIRRHTVPLQLCQPETGVIDILSMNYSGNQLTSVSDASNLIPEMGYILGDHDGAYGYDPNGNMSKIGNNSITLGYNFLNLPSTKGMAGNDDAGAPAWTYTADGQKLKYENREYVDGIEYKDGKLYAIHHAEGRIFPKEQTQDEINSNAPLEWQYQFNLNDHLGNTRIVIDESGQPIQENNYYPFGMNMENIDIVEDKGERDTRFTYNGKEMNEDLGWHDYGARFYDPAIARFSTIDPLAEEFSSWTPYHYVHNNPILLTDPTGMRADTLGFSGTPEFVQNAKNDIQTIRESSPDGAELVDFLDSHETTIEISEASSILGALKDLFSEGSGDRDHVLSSMTEQGMTTTNGVKFGVQLRYSRIDGVELDGIDSKGIEVLFHELVHAKQFVTGEMGCLRSCGMTDKQIRGRVEAKAVQETNVFRMRTGRGSVFRKTYRGVPILNNKNEIIEGSEL